MKARDASTAAAVIRTGTSRSAPSRRRRAVGVGSGLSLPAAMPFRAALARRVHDAGFEAAAVAMNGNDPACELLTSLALAIRAVAATDLHRLPVANVALALRYVETTRELERLEQRAVGCCAYLSETLATQCSAERVGTARRCAIDAVEALRASVAMAPLTKLAAALPNF